MYRPPMERIHFVFICQGGTLEGKSLLLAASMRLHFGDAHGLTAAVPVPPEHWPAPHPDTLHVLRALDVAIRPVRNAIADDFPYGNKMSCLDLADDCAQRVYIDSDMLMLRGFGEDALPVTNIAAVPASVAIADDAAWAGFHAEFGLPLPPRRLVALISQQRTVPYFNGGFIAVRNEPEFGDCWGDTCRRLRALPGLAPNIRDRFLDQVALTLAAARLGTAIHALPLTWNFPSWNLALGEGPTPIFFHYQSPERLLREMRTVVAVDAACAAFPEVRAALRRIPDFAALPDNVAAAMAS